MGRIRKLHPLLACDCLADETARTRPSKVEAHMAGSISYGSASDTEEDHDLIEFRWMERTSRLHIKQNPVQVRPSRSSTFLLPVRLDHFLFAFTASSLYRKPGSFNPFLH